MGNIIKFKDGNDNQVFPVTVTSAIYDEENNTFETILNGIRNMVGHPVQAATAAAMTDTTKVYVYTGSESGYDFGDWYYYDGSSWVDGGVYNSVAFDTDTTLAVSGMAADAKAVGDELDELKSDLDLVIVTNEIYSNPEITVTGTGTYVNEIFYTYSPIKVGDVFKWTYDSSTGSTAAAPVFALIRNDADTNIDAYNGASGYSVTITQAMITSGATKIVFQYYPAQGTALPTGSATLVNLKIVNTSEPDVTVGTQLKSALDALYLSNVGIHGDTLTESDNLCLENWEHTTYGSGGAYSETAYQTYTAMPPTIAVTGGDCYALSWGTNGVSGANCYMYIQEFNSGGTRVTYSATTYTDGQVVAKLNSETTKIGLMVYCSTTPSSWEDLIPKWTQVVHKNYVTPYKSHIVLPSSILEPEVEEVNIRLSNVVKTIAHRGDNITAPICTAPSYIIARKENFTVAENDLWLSSDGELVMWHDPTLARLGTYLYDINGYSMYTDGTTFYYVDSANSVYTWNGSQYVASSKALSSLTRCQGSDYTVTGLTLAVLKRIDFGRYKHMKFAGTQILTFAEWVLLCKQLGMSIYIDKKLSYTTATLTAAANIVKNYGMSKYASWLSLSTSEIETLRSIIPGARCGILSHPTQELITQYAPYNTGDGFFFDGDAKTGMTEAVIHLGLSNGFDVEVYYVDYASGTTEEQIYNTIRTAISYGVTGMTIDHYNLDDIYSDLFDSYQP